MSYRWSMIVSFDDRISVIVFLPDTWSSQKTKPTGLVSWSQIYLPNSIAVLETVRSYQFTKDTVCIELTYLHHIDAAPRLLLGTRECKVCFKVTDISIVKKSASEPGLEYANKHFGSKLNISTVNIEGGKPHASTWRALTGERPRPWWLTIDLMPTGY